MMALTLWLLIAGGIFLAALEGLARRAIRPKERLPRGLFAAHPTLGYVLNPGFCGRSTSGIEYRISSLGLRDCERAYLEQTGKKRLLALGNSFAMGAGEAFAETFLVLLEAELRRADEGLEVVKAGVGGYGTRHELLYYQEFGRRCHPAAILVLFSIATDFRNNLAALRGQVRDGRLVPAYRHHRAKKFLEGHSSLYLLLMESLRGCEAIATRLNRLGLIRTAYPQHVSMLCREYGTDQRRALAQTLDALAGFVEAGRQAGCPVILCAIPDKLQVDDGYFARYIARLATPPEHYDREKPNRLLEDFCAAHGVVYIDFLPRFRELRAQGDEVYLKGDIHWNLRGRRSAAEFAARHVLPSLAAGHGEAAGRGRALPLEVQAAEMKEVDAARWNAEISQVAEARIQQSFQGAQIRCSLDGVRPLFLSVRRDGQLAGQLLLYHGFIHPELLQWCRPLLRTRTCRQWWGVYRWWGGPLIHDKSRYGEVLRALLQHIDSRAREEEIFAIKDAMPPFYEPDFDGRLVDEIYEEFGFAKREMATIVLELGAELETLWKKLSRDARQKVGKAERLGIRIVEADTEEGLRRYYAVRLENSRRNNVRGPHLDGILAARPIYIEKGLGKVFLAEYQGLIVSGQMLVVLNGNIHLAGICQSDYACAQGLPANDLMQWHIIQWGHAQGCRRIDWAGYTPDPHTDKERGINNFKAKWGGTVIPYRVYNKIYGERRHRSLTWFKDKARVWGFR